MFLMMKIFVFSLLGGASVICMESKNWWEYWMFLEMNSLAFIIFLFSEKKKEKIFIFLIFQTLSSSLMMMFIFMEKWVMEENLNKMVHYIILTSIIMKIGMFPFQNWLIKVMKEISWVSMMVLFSWQKIIPIMVLMKTIMKIKMFTKTLILSMLMLNFMLIKLSNMKIIMTISSLIHNTWMLMPLVMMKEVSMTYLLSYTLVLMPLLMNFTKVGMKNIMSQAHKKVVTKEMKILMLSISGIPPSIGFIMKMIVMASLLLSEKTPKSMVILISSSCMTFYVYLQAFMKYFFLEKTKMMKNLNEKNNGMKEISWIILMIPMFMWY